MQITQALIRRVIPNVNRERLDEAVAAISMWAAHYGINTNERLAAFLANVMHESANLNAMSENLNYSADGLRKTFPKYFKTAEDAAAYARKPQQIANRVYANRNGNGNEASGDGWRYRGRGLMQLTFKANYKSYGDSDLCIGNPVTNPDIISKFPEAYKSAMWFFEKNGLNQLADKGDFEGIVKRINGGTNGLANRMYLWRKFRKEFGLK